MLYASATAALAVLEARAHLEPGDARRRHRLDCFCAVLRPGEAWCIDPAALPADWKRSHGWTRAVGSGWLATGQGAALLVPSVLAPGELNVLLNPRHPAFHRWIRDSVRQDLRFDARLLRLG